jgi:hypothetical protein
MYVRCTLFHRCKTNTISQPYIDIPEVSQSLAPLLTETPYEDHSLTILVRFFEHRKKSWFVSEEPFETWCLSLSITSINQEELNDRFASTVMKISELMDEHKEHIPIITNADLIPFEYTIQRGDESWKGYIKKMLDH